MSVIVIKEIEASDTWPLRHSVMWPDKPLDYVKLEKDNLGTHFGLFVNDELVTITSLFIKDGNAQFRKLATLETEQGKGHATKIIERIIAESKIKKAKRIWCNARADKTSFYKRFGMSETDKTFTKGGIDYVIMEKLLA